MRGSLHERNPFVEKAFGAGTGPIFRSSSLWMSAILLNTARHIRTYSRFELSRAPIPLFTFPESGLYSHVDYRPVP